MASGFGKKKKFGEKIKGFFLKVALPVSLLGGVAGYEYGTVTEKTVKVTGFGDNGRVETTAGTFNNTPSMFHLKNVGDVDNLDNKLWHGRTYKIKSYGDFFDMGIKNRNILEVREVSENERDKAQEGQKTQKTQAQNPSATPGPAALSGATTVVEIVTGGQVVNMTVPTEVVNSITVNSIKPVQPIRIVQPPSPGQ